jgi:hypothetical protein
MRHSTVCYRYPKTAACEPMPAKHGGMHFLHDKSSAADVGKRYCIVDFVSVTIFCGCHART